MNGMLNEIAEQQLRKAGWYPGRKVDISDQIEFWESLGYETFDAAVKFMEEYGKLHITDKYVSTFSNELREKHHTTYVTEILEFYNEYTDEDKYEFNFFGRVKEKFLPVVKFDDEVTYFIFESGGIYCDVGLIAETPEVLWNECYSVDYGIALPWDKIGTGEQRKRYIRKSLREYL